MAVSQNGPLPSRLILLSDLHAFRPGDKVRFLGCVTGYSTKEGILTMEHDHPLGNELKALVDVTLLVSTLKSTDTQTGEWVNVIGYVVEKGTSNAVHAGVHVQAILLWACGPLKIQAYEKSLDRQKSERDF